MTKAMWSCEHHALLSLLSTATVAASPDGVVRSPRQIVRLPADSTDAAGKTKAR